MKGIQKIEDLGYGPFFELARQQLGMGDFGVARVISEYKEAYRVKNTNGEYLAKITGKQMFEAVSREDYPAVGDWVVISETDNDHVVIHRILPRVTMIKRRFGPKNKDGEKNKIQVIATNIDVAFVVESVDRDYNLNRFERYFAIVQDSGVEPVIVLNKVDLLMQDDLEIKLSEIKERFPGIDVVLASTVTSSGLSGLSEHIKKGKTYCFIGSSGVGKSSLINKLIGEQVIETGKISEYTGRGKHTTTGRQMYFLENGGIVIDNPGIREVGMTDTEGVDKIFSEITSLAQKCKFGDCTHVHEPDCAVLSALGSGQLDQQKYANFINLKKEAEFFAMNDGQKREKGRQFSKFVKKAKKDLKKFRHKGY